MNRKEYEERMTDSKYRELKVTKDCPKEQSDNKDYVFISYRGNSWKKVLTEIVYKLQKEYKLRVYFDKDFASETNVWIKQFIGNMDSPHCKAFLCFFDEGYVTSYATLLELMHAMNPRSKLKDSIFSISFPIDWKKLDSDDRNTGLGVEDEDNPTWQDEKDAFDDEFDLLIDKYPKIKPFNPKKTGILRACDCKDIMAILQPKNKRDYYDDEAFYKQFIIEPLRKKCPSVFAEEEISEDNDTIENEGKQTSLQTKKGESAPKQDTEVRESFEESTLPDYTASELAGEKALWEYKTKGTRSKLIWNGQTTGTDAVITVLKDSVAATPSQNFEKSCKSAFILKTELEAKGIIQNSRFTEDYTYNKVATMINLLNGGSVSTPAEKISGHLRKVDETDSESITGESKSSSDISINKETKIEDGKDNNYKITDARPLNIRAVDTNAPIISEGEQCYKYKNALIRCDLNSKECVVLKGSRIDRESPRFETNAPGAKRKKDELISQGVIVDDMFMKDYEGKLATMLNLINGGSVSANREKLRFKKIEDEQ